MVEMVSEKICSKCLGDPQPLENFHRDKNKRDGRSTVCKTCTKSVSSGYYAEHRETIIANAKTWANEHPGETLKRVIEWAKNNPAKAAANKKRWKERNPDHGTSEYTRKLNRERRVAHRLEAITAMGGQCECCGLSDVVFICFDHIGGWGASHRKVIHQSSLPGWLKKHNYPKGDGTICATCGEVHGGIRLLCYNCNMSVAADPDGICAHKRVGPVDYSRYEGKRRYEREWRAKLREEVLNEYGAECACCHEDNPAFLSIEHVGGWGGAHRTTVNDAAIWSWLKKHCYPKGGEICPTCSEVHEAIAVTCFNCNMAAAKNNHVCPHQDREALAA